MVTEKWRPITFCSHNEFLAIAEDAGNMKAKVPVLYVLAYIPCLAIMINSLYLTLTRDWELLSTKTHGCRKSVS